jgi:hypothetical protein
MRSIPALDCRKIGYGSMLRTIMLPLSRRTSTTAKVPRKSGLTCNRCLQGARKRSNKHGRQDARRVSTAARDGATSASIAI